MKKMYINEKDLNEYEKENGKVSYKTLVKRYFNDMVLCNNITLLFHSTTNGKYIEPELEIGTDYDEENDCYIDIYQYFIVDQSNWQYEELKELMKQNNSNDIILYYIDYLDMYILGVPHFGTGWDYVLTDIEYTTDINGGI